MGMYTKVTAFCKYQDIILYPPERQQITSSLLLEAPSPPYKVRIFIIFISFVFLKSLTILSIAVTKMSEQLRRHDFRLNSTGIHTAQSILL